jgi:hypothetical protein
MVKLSVLVASAVLFSGIPSAHACTCIEPKGPENTRIMAAAREAAFVGVVRITSIKFVTEIHDQNGKYVGLRDAATSPERDEWLVASYETDRVWKQSASAENAVVTGLSEAACGLPFKLGQAVLLYAYDPDYTKLMHADSCGRSVLLENAAKDIAALSKRYTTKSPHIKHLEPAKEP